MPAWSIAPLQVGARVPHGFCRIHNQRQSFFTRLMQIAHLFPTLLARWFRLGNHYGGRIPMVSACHFEDTAAVFILQAREKLYVDLSLPGCNLGKPLRNRYILRPVS